ncbi:MAG: GNAT family N-acetyltransferase [Deltaproteobacteria bacterium]|nr:GNAT family N-acetyltransferase [Deltaproteobacteria bacterium]
MGRLTPPQLLSENHVLENFDCGDDFLNDWLKKYALINNRANSAKTFVISDDRQVVGYYSLAMGSVDYEVATPRIKKGLARHPIPVVVLARLAVDLRYQKKRIGIAILKDALLRALTVSKHIGARAVFVNAKNENAGNFYQKQGFMPLPIDSLKLMLLMKDLHKTLETP